MRESIRRDRGSAKDLFAATGVLQRKIKARQWLEREGAEDGQLLAIAGCGVLPPLGQAARDFLQTDATKRPFPQGCRRPAYDLMESKLISRTAFEPEGDLQVRRDERLGNARKRSLVEGVGSATSGPDGSAVANNPRNRHDDFATAAVDEQSARRNLNSSRSFAKSVGIGEPDEVILLKASENAPHCRCRRSAFPTSFRTSR